MAKSSLQIVESSTASQGEFRMIPHSQIKPNSNQPRTFFSEKDLADLADSIDGEDQTTPVLVTLIPSENKFTLVGGERRWRACCILAERRGTDVLMKAVIEPYKGEEWLFRAAFMDNLHRQDMHPLDIAVAFKRLREFNETFEKIAKLYGVSVSYVTNYLLLNDLDDRVKQLMHPNRGKEQRLGVTHAIEIAKIKDGDLQFKIADETLEARLTVRDMQYMIIKRASAAGSTVYGYRGGKDRKPSDDYKVLGSFLGRTETWLDRCRNRIEFSELYLFRDNPEKDLEGDLEQIERIKKKFDEFAKLLDDFDKA